MMNKTQVFLVFISLWMILILSACQFSLAEDVTPPPGAEQTLSSVTPTALEAENVSETTGSTAATTAPSTSEEQPTLLPLGTGTPTSAEATSGKITGMVINASDQAVPPDLEVTLHSFDQMNETLTQKAPLDAAGAFEFSNITINQGMYYVVTVEYKGVV